VAAFIEILPRLETLRIEHGGRALRPDVGFNVISSMLQGFAGLDRSTLTSLTIGSWGFNLISCNLLLNVLTTHARTLKTDELYKVQIYGPDWMDVFRHIHDGMTLDKLKVSKLCDGVTMEWPEQYENIQPCIEFVTTHWWDRRKSVANTRDLPSDHPYWAFFDPYGFMFCGKGVKGGLKSVLSGRSLAEESTGYALK